MFHVELKTSSNWILLRALELEGPIHILLNTSDVPRETYQVHRILV